MTGGAGFIGSHLCERLLAEGHWVTALDNLATGDAANVAHLREHPRFDFRLHDVTVGFDTGPVDRVFHLAGAPPGPRDPHHGVDIVLDSVSGTLNALRVADWHGAKFLLASSRAVYGEGRGHAPIPETAAGGVDTASPEAPHAEGKRAAETLVVQYAQANRIDARIARLFDTYGPRMGLDARQHPIAELVAQVHRGSPVWVPGPAREQRAFCHVDDVVDGLLGLMEATADLAPVNLGHPVGTTLAELAGLVAEVGGQELTAASGVHVREQAPICWVPSIERARRRFGFSPAIGLEAGIRALLADDVAPPAAPEPVLLRTAEPPAAVADGTTGATVSRWPGSKIDIW